MATATAEPRSVPATEGMATSIKERAERWSRPAGLDPAGAYPDHHRRGGRHPGRHVDPESFRPTPAWIPIPA